MTWFKVVALGLPLASAPVASAAIAGPLAPSAMSSKILFVKDADAGSDADKRAKAIECSKQADAKHLHGDARLKFRAACKDKSST